MKILCIIDSLGSGGAQRQLVTLAIGFKSLGHEVCFLVYREDNFFKEDLDNHNIAIHVVLESNYFKRFLKMRSYIRSNKWEAVISFLEASNFICSLSSLPYRNWKLIVGERSANPNISKSFKSFIYRYFHFFPDYIISNSKANIKIIKRVNPFIANSKLRVIYNIVDHNLWMPKEKGFENEKFKLVVASSHRYLKNSIGLIEAVNILSYNEKSQLEIEWYGGGSNDKSLQEAMKLTTNYSLDNVIKFKKPLKNLEYVFNECDSIGLFSFYEGLPNVICEGMAAGKAIIASNISDIPFLLGENSQCLFNPNNVLEIKKSISWLLSLSQDELIKVGLNNRKIALKLFNKEAIINEYMNILEN